MNMKVVMVCVLAALLTVSINFKPESYSFAVSSAFAASDEDKDKDKDEGESKDESKVTLCHFPPGSPENPSTLSVAESALGAHLAHGDYEGECPCICPPGVASCVCADGKDGIPSPASTAAPSSQRSILGK